MAAFSKPIPLTLELASKLGAFNCGELSLDLWLKTKALANEVKGGSRTFIVLSQLTGEIAGYFTLSSHSIEQAAVNAKLRRNMPRPLPTILLGRLAVDKKYQCHGLGESMLAEAVRIAKQAALNIGVVALVVHPISENAANFYRKHGFSMAKTEKPMLFMNLHDV